MNQFLIPLLQGLLAVFAISGVGRLALWPVSSRDLGWYWQLAFIMLGGQAVTGILVEAVLLGGIGSVHTLRHLAWILISAAVAGHLLSPSIRIGRTIGQSFRENKLASAVLLTAWLTNLVVALAPSTKIDELYYHMLTPKRIVEDGGLRFYRLPLESAIVPHMHYQIALSIVHALGAPDAGNVLSWGYSVVLGIFIVGFLMDATNEGRLALLLGSLCSVGLYATVWHTTGGAHALGDLALVVAVAGVLRPQALMPVLNPARYTLLLVTAASVAASTKLSLWPICFVVSVLVVWRAAQNIEHGRNLTLLGGLALLPLIVLQLPLMIWTYLVSGSPWGPVFANVLAPSVFPPILLQEMHDMQMFNPSEALLQLRYALVEFSPVLFIAVIWLLWTAWRGCKTSRLAALLLLFQAVLVAWKLHFDFRFLGGLEYVAVLTAGITLARLEGDWSSDHSGHWPQGRELWGERLLKSRNWLLFVIVLPWLGAQIYYARPFAQVVSGRVSRNQFLERYVALTRDFTVLDRILPKDAVLYVGNTRVPNFYAPRPVVLSLLDMRGRPPIYRLIVELRGDKEVVGEESDLDCGTTVYANNSAIIETYRTPGVGPLMGDVKVQECHTIGGLDAPPGNPKRF